MTATKADIVEAAGRRLRLAPRALPLPADVVTSISAAFDEVHSELMRDGLISWEPDKTPDWARASMIALTMAQVATEYRSGQELLTTQAAAPAAMAALRRLTADTEHDDEFVHSPYF